MDQGVKKLLRSRTDRVISGVCGGLAAYFSIDPVITRIVFVLLAFADGIGVVVYILLWVFVPEEPGPEVTINHEEKVREFVQQAGAKVRSIAESAKSEGVWWSQPRNIVGLLILGVGIILLLQNTFSWHWLRWEVFWPLLLIIFGVAIIVKKK